MNPGPYPLYEKLFKYSNGNCRVFYTTETVSSLEIET